MIKSLLTQNRLFPFSFACYSKILSVAFSAAIVPCVVTAQAPLATYPKITGYVGVVHPIVTYGKDKPQYNFNGSYIGGLATGINIWKSAKIGFSFEFVPFIKAADGTSRMYNFLFHPGALFALGKGYTLATRAAFETGGRYGVTPVFNKVVKRNKSTAYYTSISVPARFGNNLPATAALAFQFGVAF